jgi:hypothetical protein
MDDTVKRPSGGLEVFLEMNFKACLKLQNVSGKLGFTNRIFMWDVFAG